MKRQKEEGLAVKEASEQCERTRKRHVPAKIAAVLVACALAVAVPVLAVAASLQEDYTWYTAHAGTEADPYVITSAGQFKAFSNVVNGTADVDGDGAAEPASTFAGKVVQLQGSSINFWGEPIAPVGGQNGTYFDGTFDGNGTSLDAFVVDTSVATKNLGIFGSAGKNSVIKNVTIGQTSSLALSLSATQKTAIEHVGMLVGYTEGVVSGCVNNGSVTLSHAMDQTRDVVFPIQEVGGLIGQGLGDVSNCTNNGAIAITETGAPFKADANETEWSDQSTLVLSVGGIIGCAGDEDSSLAYAATQKTPAMPSDEAKLAKRHGTITNCVNTAKIEINTPAENGRDRFNNLVYASSNNVGGIAGYSRGSVLSCENSGYLRVANRTSAGAAGGGASGAAGIVGALRARIETTSYNGNFTSEGWDDGCAGDVIVVENCVNSGNVWGNSFSAGIVGRAGTYANVTACVNEASTKIIAQRDTKPFPSGVVGSTAATVSYCANLGTVVAGTWDNEEAQTVKGSSGYYAAGLVGNTVYFTQPDDSGVQAQTTPTPEVYGCYNAGQVTCASGGDGWRSRALVGDNAGYVHDNIAEEGKVYLNKLVYGDNPETDTENSGGTSARNYVVTNAELKNNTIIVSDTVSAEDKLTALGILNTNSAADGWKYFWVKIPGTQGTSGGYPVLNTKVSWAPIDLSTATASLAANAQYTGGEAVPEVNVVLANGTVLQQSVDFRVEPQAGAVEITASGSAPYKATVVGIGNYSGQAANTVSYGIDKGDLANCSVSIKVKTFNWEAQEPSADDVEVRNSVGDVVDPSEYTFYIDPYSENLTDGKAINAKRYDVVVEASANSKRFVGSTQGVFIIKTAKIAWDRDEEKLAQYATVSGIKYLGKDYAWESTTHLVDVKDQIPSTTFAYTGYSIQPEVTGVVYKGRDLVLGRDYRVTYGSAMETDSEESRNNLGIEGKTDVGYIIVRYVSGSNFSNQDNMKFLIDGTSTALLDLKDAEIRGIDEEILFESGSAYRPVEVYYGGSALTEGKDYTITYTNNDRIGTASFVVSAVSGSRFTGSISGTFKIVEGAAYEFTYAYDEQAGTASVTGVVYNGSNETFDMVIPATTVKDGVTYTVTEIADKAFGVSSASGYITDDPKKKITSVVIPATVERIGKYAFATGGASKSEWSILDTVTFADIYDSALTTIDEGAFEGCGNLKAFTFPPKVATIANRAFHLGGTAAGESATLHSLTFLTTDPKLPSSVGKTFTFTGVGYDNGTVYVYSSAEATAVKQLAESNAGDSGTANAGRHFAWRELSLKTYTISYAAGAGAYGLVPSTSTQPEGSVITVPSPDASLRCDGYVFAGWKNSADGKIYAAGSLYTMPGKNVAFEAQWQKRDTYFTDVDYYGDSTLGWAAPWITQASEMGLMTGLRDPATQELTGEFGVGTPLTRAQAIVVVYRAATGASDTEGFGTNNTPFVDVTETDYYTNALNWAYASGVVTGDIDSATNTPLGTFRPNSSITRQEIAIMLWRLCGSPIASDGGAAYAKAADAGGEWKESTAALQWTACEDILSGSVDVDGIHLNAYLDTMREQAAKIFVAGYQFVPKAQADARMSAAAVDVDAHDADVSAHADALARTNALALSGEDSDAESAVGASESSEQARDGDVAVRAARAGEAS